MSAHTVTQHFECALYGLAGGVANALAGGRAAGEARVAAVRADLEEARTLDAVAEVARNMTRDRLERRRLEAENTMLREELAALRARALRAEAALIRAAHRAA